MALDLLMCPHCSTSIVPSPNDTCPCCGFNINKKLTPEQVRRLDRGKQLPAAGVSVEQRFLLLAILVVTASIPPAVSFLSGATAITFVIVACGSGLTCLFLAGWAFAYVYAPVATKRLTAFMVIGALVFSLIPFWLIQTRENARRARVVNYLKNKGLEIHVTSTRRGPTRYGELELGVC